MTAWEAAGIAQGYRLAAAIVSEQRVYVQESTGLQHDLLALARATARLEDCPNILAMDQAEREADRAGRYAAIARGSQERAWRVDFDAEEHAHKQTLAALRREREVADAELARNAAKRRLEYQKTVAPGEEKIWLTRIETKLLDEQGKSAVQRAALNEHLEVSASSTKSEDVIGTYLEELDAQMKEATANNNLALARRLQRAAEALSTDDE
jgi:hypothetical protein